MEQQPLGGTPSKIGIRLLSLIDDESIGRHGVASFIFESLHNESASSAKKSTKKKQKVEELTVGQVAMTKLLAKLSSDGSTTLDDYPEVKHASRKNDEIGKGSTSYRPIANPQFLPRPQASDFVCNNEQRIVMFGSKGSFTSSDPGDDLSPFKFPFTFIGNTMDELADLDSLNAVNIKTSAYHILKRQSKPLREKRSLSVTDLMENINANTRRSESVSLLCLFPYPSGELRTDKIHYLRFHIVSSFLIASTRNCRSISRPQLFERSILLLEGFFKACIDNHHLPSHLFSSSLLIRFLRTSIALFNVLYESCVLSDLSYIPLILQIYSDYGHINQDLIQSMANQFSAQLEAGGCFQTEILRFQSLLFSLLPNNLLGLLEESTKILNSADISRETALRDICLPFCGKYGIFSTRVCFNSDLELSISWNAFEYEDSPQTAFVFLNAFSNI